MRRTDIVAQAKSIREATQRLARTAPDSEALACPALFDMWEADADYMVGDIRKEENKLYRCLLEHTSQASWSPSASPSLWVRISDPAEEWPQWVQPAGSTEAYALGAKVTHNKKHWISEVDNNVWEPGIYGWTEAAE